MTATAALQFLQLLATLLTLAASSGNPATIQKAITQTANGIAYVQESGAINPVTPVYYTNESETQIQTSSSPVPPTTSLGSTAPTSAPEVWTCKNIGGGGWAMVDQNGVENTSTFVFKYGLTAQRDYQYGGTPCNPK